MEAPQVSTMCSATSNKLYLKTFFNFSITHSGDTIVYSLNPVPKPIMYHIDDLHTEFVKYMKNIGNEVEILNSEQTKNGSHLLKDVNEFRQNLYEPEKWVANEDSTFIYWFTNESGTREYDGTPYGSLNEYNYHSNVTSYVLVVNNGKVCFFNGVRTFAWYDSSWKFYRKSVSRLFDPYFNPSGKKTRKSN